MSFACLKNGRSPDLKSRRRINGKSSASSGAQASSKASSKASSWRRSLKTPLVGKMPASNFAPSSSSQSATKAGRTAQEKLIARSATKRLVGKMPATSSQAASPPGLGGSAKAQEVWLRNKASWTKMLPWLVASDGDVFQLKCAACSATKQDNDFARGVPSVPLPGNLKRHDNSRQHKMAMSKLGLGKEPEIQAPSFDRFKELIETLKRNAKLSFKASGHASTEVKLRESLVSSMWLKDQFFLRNAVSIALHQDVKSHTLFVRFRACDANLCSHHGLFGAQSLGLESGSEGLVKAMWKILECFCATDDGLDQALLKHIQQKVELLNADGASDEQVSLRLLASKCFSNIVARTRDRTHACQRILSRPWASDEVMSEMLERHFASDLM